MWCLLIRIKSWLTLHTQQLYVSAELSEQEAFGCPHLRLTRDAHGVCARKTSPRIVCLAFSMWWVERCSGRSTKALNVISATQWNVGNITVLAIKLVFLPSVWFYFFCRVFFIYKNDSGQRNKMTLVTDGMEYVFFFVWVTRMQLNLFSADLSAFLRAFLCWYSSVLSLLKSCQGHAGTNPG